MIGKKLAWIAALNTAIVSASVEAQTLFDFPDSRVDITNFRYVENCVAVAQRIQDSLDYSSAVDPDTLAVQTIDGMKPIPVQVVEATKKCLAKFTPEQIPTQFAQMALQAFLAAGRDADAATLVRLRVNSIPDSLERAFVLDSFARAYINASPRRIPEAHALADTVLEYYGNYYKALRPAGMCLTLVRVARMLRDNPSVLKYGQAALDYIAKATPEELEADRDGVIPIVVRELNHPSIEIRFLIVCV